MTKWFQENGYLSDHGKEALAKFKTVLTELFSLPEVKDMNEAEVLTLQANMLNLISRQVSGEILSRKEEVVRLAALSDEHFDSFLAEKYGPDYMLKASLTKAESDRSLESFSRRIKKAMEEGLAIHKAVVGQTSLPSFDPGPRYK